MSEYQYYEFAAVDHPLTPQQQAELRSCSSRATITPAGFVNEYHWGSLKGDPLDWMQRYFDAHVYSADWGERELLLRLPLAALEADTLALYAIESRSRHNRAFSATQHDGHWILNWNLRDEEGELAELWVAEDGPGWMGQLLPLREELLRGDLRPLYLGWLADASQGKFANARQEPPLPTGLGQLSAAQLALVKFLHIDPDWLGAAAAASPALPAVAHDDADMDAWLQEQSDTVMRLTMRLLLAGHGVDAERSVRRAYLAWQQSRAGAGTASVPEQRAIADIESGVQAQRTQRLTHERLTREAEAARLEAQYSALLDRLVNEAPQVWQEIDAKVSRGTGSAYEEAFKLLQTLNEAMKRSQQEADFRRSLVRLLERHGRRPAWMARLHKAGLA